MLTKQLYSSGIISTNPVGCHTEVHRVIIGFYVFNPDSVPGLLEAQGCRGNLFMDIILLVII